MKQAWVGLGSNLDEPLAQLTDAYRRLAANPQIHVEAASSVYLSAPQGPQDQPDFYNAVLWLRTSMTPEKLLTSLLATETEMGRNGSGTGVSAASIWIYWLMRNSKSALLIWCYPTHVPTNAGSYWIL